MDLWFGLEDPVARKLVGYTALILVSLLAGYVCRKLALLGERTSRVLMTLIAVFGYALIQLFALWGLELRPELVFLPILGGLNVLLMFGVGMLVARKISDDPSERGIFVVSSGLTNTGVTMGGLVLLAYYGEQALGWMSMYCIMSMPIVIGVMYPLCRHYSPAFKDSGQKLGKLMLTSILDWRSIGMATAIAGLVLNWKFGHKSRPAFVEDWHIIDWIVYTTIVMSFFAIGLRTSLRHSRHIVRLILVTALIRFVISGIVAIGLVTLTLAFFPLSQFIINVILIESVMPVAVTMVAGVNMFRLNTKVASTLFVVNTLMFLAFVLPILYVVFQVVGYGALEGATP
jgi:predicted permease